MLGFGKKTIKILAPISGRVVPLEEVPDQVFAEKMAGDGVAIEPDEEGLAVAPCDGELAALFPTGHAFGIVGPEGIEVLVHIGIETVALDGEGFTLLASAGDKVKAGDPIVRFDRAILAAKAPSILTPVILTTGEKIKSFKAASGKVQAGKDILMEVEPA